MRMLYCRTGAMAAAFVLGYFSPWAAAYSWLIRWLIVAMMFPAMLQARFSLRSVRPVHLMIFAANLAIGLGGWAVFAAAGRPELAQAAFFTGITPTAAAAPVIVGLLGGRVDFALSAFLVTNLGMAPLLVLLIPAVVGNPAPGMFLKVLGSLAVVIGVPLAAAVPVRCFYPKAQEIPKRLKNVTFFLWTLVIFLIIGNASEFLRSRPESGGMLAAEIALLSLAICVLNFTVGRRLGPRKFRRESGQVLGQKNTSLTIYLALGCAGPAAALGPACYVFWHNTWNALQLHWYSRRRLKRARRD